MMGSQNRYFRALSLSTCYIVAWLMDEPVFEFVCGWRGGGDSSCQLCGCSMREIGMGGYGGIGMVT